MKPLNVKSGFFLEPLTAGLNFIHCLPINKRAANWFSNISCRRSRPYFNSSSAKVFTVWAFPTLPHFKWMRSTTLIFCSLNWQWSAEDSGFQTTFKEPWYVYVTRYTLLVKSRNICDEKHHLVRVNIFLLRLQQYTAVWIQGRTLTAFISPCVPRKHHMEAQKTQDGHQMK